jgi:hypothetical protein
MLDCRGCGEPGFWACWACWAELQWDGLDVEMLEADHTGRAVSGNSRLHSDSMHRGQHVALLN